MYNDYIITVDENGEPYIAHWFGLGHKNPPRNHKYVAKIKTPKGIRYFYTNADLKAYYFNQRVKTKINNLLSRKKPEPNRPSSHQKNVTGTAKDGWNKRRETVSEAQTNKTLNDLHDLHETYEKAANEFSYYNGRTYDGRPYSLERARKTSAQEKHQKQQAMKTAEADYQKKKDEIVKMYERSLESGGYVKKTKPKERIIRKSNDSYVLVDTLENDAKVAHLDDLFSALEKASRETSAAYKAAVKKAEARDEYAQTHPTSLVNKMPDEDPAYLEAYRKEQDIEDILNRILYK